MIRDFVSILEAAYRVEQTPDEWLDGVIDACMPRLDLGHGVVGFFVDCSSSSLRLWGWRASDTVCAKARQLWQRYNTELPLEVKRRMHVGSPVHLTLSHEHAHELQGLADWSKGMCTPRSWSIAGVNGLDASLRGCCVAGFDVKGEKTITAEDVESFSMVSAHLAAGARLVQRLGDPNEQPRTEAVLAPGGKVLHAEGPARDELARAALRDAAVGADRARVQRGRSDDAVEAWQALVAGRWSLVDTFERDGRRFLLAYPNEPPAESSGAMTARERQVANAALLGHSDKLIAYELGLSTPTVARVLARLRRRLGASNRVELVRRLRAESERPAARSA